MPLWQPATTNNLPSYEPKPFVHSKLPSWIKCIPFLGVHVAALAVFLPMVEATWTAIILCTANYFIRMFGITGGYHRYFAHRAYKTSRWFQFVIAWLGAMAMQKGPLWWAGHHRHHHQHSDQDPDLHSPHIDTVWYSHVGWILDKDTEHTDWKSIHDFAKFPELRVIDNWYWVPGVLNAVACFFIGGLSGLIWGFFVSSVLVYHATFCINSLAHLIGRVRYKTTDKSKNSLFLALITMGEGWHNNHHYYASSANQGFFWWEIDLSYCILKVFSWCGLIWDLRGVPAKKLIPTADVETTVVEAKPEPVKSILPPIVEPIKETVSAAVSSVKNAAASVSATAASAAATVAATAAATVPTLTHAANSAAPIAEAVARST